MQRLQTETDRQTHGGRCVCVCVCVCVWSCHYWCAGNISETFFVGSDVGNRFRKPAAVAGRRSVVS